MFEQMGNLLSKLWRWYRGRRWWWQAAIGVGVLFVGLAVVGSVLPSEGSDERAQAVDRLGATPSVDPPVVAPTLSVEQAQYVAGIATADASRSEQDRISAEQTLAARPTGTPIPPPWKDGGPLSDASAREALADGKEMIRSLDLGKPVGIEIGGDDSITVAYKAESALKETDLLTIGAQTSFSAHRALFTNPRVTKVTVIVLADWTDRFGAESQDVTTVSTLDRLTVARINWGGLEDRVILDNKHIFCISDAYKIHGGIYSRLGDTGCLTGAVR